MTGNELRPLHAGVLVQGSSAFELGADILEESLAVEEEGMFFIIRLCSGGSSLYPADAVPVGDGVYAGRVSNNGTIHFNFIKVRNAFGKFAGNTARAGHGKRAGNA